MSAITDDVIIEPPGCIKIGSSDQANEIHEIAVGRASFDFPTINARDIASASASVPAITLLQRANQPANLVWTIWTEQLETIGDGGIVQAASAGEGVITLTAANYGTANITNPAAIDISYLAIRHKRTQD